jgi:TfoX/Sxy family transcriptional regulator of competence genes
VSFLKARQEFNHREKRGHREEWEYLKRNEMASDLNFVEFVVEQIENAGVITYRKMFGGCTLYCNGKVVALVCDNQLFVKPTEAGKSFIGNVVEAPPYPGAKPFFLIEEQIEDREWMCDLIILTEKELPMPKPKKKKIKKI